MYLVSFHHASTILEKLGRKSFITLLTHSTSGIFYPSSGISSLVQASILIILIRVFCPLLILAYPPAILSWNLLGLLQYVTSFRALIRLDIAVNASNNFPISDHDTTLFSHLLLGVSLLRKAESFTCPELLPLLNMTLLPFLTMKII